MNKKPAVRKLDDVRREIKELKAVLYNKINRRANGKPYANVAGLQGELADLKKERDTLLNPPITRKE